VSRIRTVLQTFNHVEDEWIDSMERDDAPVVCYHSARARQISPTAK
jgi:hypothetical protein